jgi:hypothetical protein
VSRSKRRRQRTDYRLAFVVSKFRLGTEPDPFCLEIRLPEDGAWTLKEVTGEVENDLEEAKGETKAERLRKIDEAVAALRQALSEGGLPKTKAVDLLAGHAGRNRARVVLGERNGTDWRVETRPRPEGQRGPRTVQFVVPIPNSPDTLPPAPNGGIENLAAEYARVSKPCETSVTSTRDSATLAAQDRQSFTPPESLVFEGPGDSSTLPPISRTTPGNHSRRVSNVTVAARYAALDRSELIERLKGNGGRVWEWLLQDRPDLVDAIDAADANSAALDVALRAGLAAWEAAHGTHS